VLTVYKLRFKYWVRVPRADSRVLPAGRSLSVPPSGPVLNRVMTFASADTRESQFLQLALVRKQRDPKKRSRVDNSSASRNSLLVSMDHTPWTRAIGGPIGQPVHNSPLFSLGVCCFFPTLRISYSSSWQTPNLRPGRSFLQAERWQTWRV
jgi:hypothetical protein